jgi:hypothetical protein
MPRKVSLLLTTLLIFSLLVSPVHAQSSLSVRLMEIRQQLMQQRQALQQQLTNRREAIQQEFTGDLIVLEARLSAHFNFYSKRLANLLNKLQSRIMKLKADGRDVTNAQGKLDEAKAKLIDANATKLKAIQAFKLVPTATNSAQRRNMILAAQDLSQQARELFVETVRLMQQTLKLIKALGVPPTPTNAAK